MWSLVSVQTDLRPTSGFFCFSKHANPQIHHWHHACSSYIQQSKTYPTALKQGKARSTLPRLTIKNPNQIRFKIQNRGKREEEEQNTRIQIKNWGKTYKAVIINGVDILLLGNHVAKAAASRILKGNARSFRTQNPIDVVTIVEFIIKTFRNLNDLWRVTVLNNDEMVRLEKGPPHLKKIEVSDGGYDDIELIFQQGNWRNFGICHFEVERDEMKLWGLEDWAWNAMKDGEGFIYLKRRGSNHTDLHCEERPIYWLFCSPLLFK